MSSREDLDRGSKAERLLKDPIFDKAFKDVELAIFDNIKACPIRDKEGLHELRLMLKLLQDLRANLEEAIGAGQLVALEIEQEKKGSIPFLGDPKWLKANKRRSNR